MSKLRTGEPYSTYLLSAGYRGSAGVLVIPRPQGLGGGKEKSEVRRILDLCLVAREYFCSLEYNRMGFVGGLFSSHCCCYSVRVHGVEVVSRHKHIVTATVQSPSIHVSRRYMYSRHSRVNRVIHHYLPMV